tara:strand:- start:439 stop:615 length:177 start_codon:yes stop_codon:yes gene_type:complete
VNKSKNIEAKDTNDPKIINGFDLLLLFTSEGFIVDESLSFFLFRRFEKFFFTGVLLTN